MRYARDEGNDREDTKMEGKKTGRRGDKKDAMKDGGWEKGSKKLPDAKFFATNQRKDN